MAPSSALTRHRSVRLTAVGLLLAAAAAASPLAGHALRAGATEWTGPVPSETTGVDATPAGEDGAARAAFAPGPIKPIVFPVAGGAPLSDDFGAPRSGHTHEGNDLMGPKGTPLLAAVDGVIESVTRPEASYGYAVVIEGADGWTYHYLHVNNDDPGTDDGNGGEAHAFPAWVKAGAKVSRGEVIAYRGDSGNAETVGPHLHFEIRQPDGTAVDPYASLRDAKAFRLYRAVPR